MVAAVVVCLLTLQFDAVSILSSPFLADVAAVTAAPIGYDPLTGQEMDAIVAAAQGVAGASALRAATANEQVDGQEVLLVERHEASKAAYAKGNWPRQGDVYVYEYATDTLIHTVVDVQSGAVITEERVRGVQLPLTEREEERALALVEADTTLWATLAARYQAITGTLLQRLDQLQVKVSVFHADVMPGRLNTAAQQCGQRRCAQVLLFTVDKTLLEIMPIVDLSQGQVVQVLDGE
jgi:Cu2+-containing amine oxidase